MRTCDNRMSTEWENVSHWTAFFFGKETLATAQFLSDIKKAD